MIYYQNHQGKSVVEANVVEAKMHKFLIHKKGDHVGVATSDIEEGEEVVGVYMDDDSTVEVASRGEIPLGHKIAIEECEPGGAVTEYGVQIGEAPEGLSVGDYVHTHNLKSARW
jgi:(2R)-sulfolactate sulfo-lyase subunit alpha